VLPVSLTPAESLEYERNNARFLGEYRMFRAANPSGTWPEFIAWARSRPRGLEAVSAWHRSQALLSLPAAKRALLADLLFRHRTHRVLVFTRDNQAAYSISSQHLIPAVTCNVRRLEREQILSAFKAGRVRALVSSRVLNEGVDVPEADVAIIVGGALGTREYLQRVGRVLRSVDGKRARIYELVVGRSGEARRARGHAAALTRKQSRGP